MSEGLLGRIKDICETIDKRNIKGTILTHFIEMMDSPAQRTFLLLEMAVTLSERIRGDRVANEY